ncbi:MIP/aquaporin family protein [soil metagenome]
MKFSLARRGFAEFLGTAFLLAIVVGSGIMGEKLSAGNAAIALLANAMATGAGLFFLITIFEQISGAHFNSVVTLTESWRGNLPWKEVPIYLISQVLGGIFGVGAANYMFELPVFFASNKIREGNAQLVAEFVATFGLMAVIQAGVKFKPNVVAALVSAYITAAYWFTSSTSFANPAVTIARAFSDTFAGISPKDVLPFIIAQFAGATVSVLVFRWLLKTEENDL